MPLLLIVGLGPAGLDRVGSDARSVLLDESHHVLVRTLAHPAAEQLSRLRTVESADRFYETEGDFDDVYAGIASHLVALAIENDTVYAVPGSALVAERTVGLVQRMAAESNIECRVIAGESFVDLCVGAVGLDPFERGLQLLDARSLPDPLPLHVPTLIAQVDQPMVAADLATTLTRTLPDDARVTVLSNLGGDDQSVVVCSLADLAGQGVGPRTSVFLDPPLTGWHGLVVTNRRLRNECPWDAKQTHHSLVNHLVEEAYETVEALSMLAPEAPGGAVDYGSYAEVEEELGDLLLQVVFHATLAAEAGAFDVEEVAEGIRRKLVHRHPHVFGAVDAPDAEAVLSNWEKLKQDEKQRDSILDGVPASLPALARAAKLQLRAASVGFDWPTASDVLDKLAEETSELRADLFDPARASEEMGDVLFTAVNVARHLGVDPELALRRSADRFADRFRTVEAAAEGGGTALGDMSLDAMDRLWEEAKDAKSK